MDYSIIANLGMQLFITNQDEGYKRRFHKLNDDNQFQ